MTEESAMTKTQLLDAINQGWNDLHTYLGTLTYEQVTIPNDAAGWTIKDHLAHLAVWEDGIWALLEKKPRAASMGVPDDIWTERVPDRIDRINAVIQQHYQDMPLREVAALFFAAHERLVEKIKTLGNADLYQPYSRYSSYPADTTDERPLINWIKGDTYEHYAEHIPWIDAIARQYETSVANLLAAIQTGWDQLNAYLDTLSETQITQPNDAAGWTVKDHVIHLAIWEDAMNALLDKRPVVTAMDIDRATWERNNFDEINAIIQRRYHDLSWADVQQKRQQVHEELIGRIQALADADLLRPHGDFQSDSTDVLGHLVGNTFGHYAEHLPWMRAIANAEGT